MGAALWVYGYFVVGHPAIFDWPTFTPHWISDFIPNLESEIGLVVCVAGTILAFTPNRG